MAATAGYQAGVEANQTQLSYGVEATWGTKPAVQFQAIRYTSETLALTKTRQRPGEINITREVSQAVTTQQAAGGTINYALSWGTYDDFFASLMQNDWTTPYVITSIGTDISASSGPEYQCVVDALRQVHQRPGRTVCPHVRLHQRDQFEPDCPRYFQG